MWGIVAALIMALFFMYLIFRLENRLLGLLVIVALVASPILLFFNLQVVANQMAVSAYLLLALIVILQTIDFCRENWNDHHVKKDGTMAEIDATSVKKRRDQEMLRLSDYLITFKDIKNLVKHIYKAIRHRS